MNLKLFRKENEEFAGKKKWKSRKKGNILNLFENNIKQTIDLEDSKGK